MPVREGQEGSRWYNRRPTGEELANWFRDVPLHDGMLHSDYIGGIVLIQSKEKSKDVDGFDAQGRPNIIDREDLVYVPYVKVDARVAYFWRWIGLNDGYVASIDPIEAAADVGLPPGFFRYTAKDPKERTVTFVGSSHRVTVINAKGELVMRPAPGTKIAATASKWDVDENALMKAETGSIGRALGMAGMLTIPGSGVATAEDMQEALSSTGAGATSDDATLPVTIVELTDDELRERAAELVRRLASANPTAYQEFTTWARQRKLVLAEAQGSVLKGAIKKLERTLEEEAVGV